MSIKYGGYDKTFTIIRKATSTRPEQVLGAIKRTWDTRPTIGQQLMINGTLYRIISERKGKIIFPYGARNQIYNIDTRFKDDTLRTAQSPNIISDVINLAPAKYTYREGTIPAEFGRDPYQIIFPFDSYSTLVAEDRTKLSEFTVFMYIKPNTPDDSSFGEHVMFQLGSDSHISFVTILRQLFFLRFSTGSDILLPIQDPIEFERFHLIAFSCKDTSENFTLFVDGVNVTEFIQPRNPPFQDINFTRDMTIGENADFTNILVYDEAFSADSIEKLSKYLIEKKLPTTEDPERFNSSFIVEPVNPNRPFKQGINPRDARAATRYSL